LLLIFETKPFDLEINQKVYLNEICLTERGEANINSDVKQVSIFNISGLLYACLIALNIATLVFTVEINLIHKLVLILHESIKHIIVFINYSKLVDKL
jgi:hypothetical protein